MRGGRGGGVGTSITHVAVARRQYSEASAVRGYDIDVMRSVRGTSINMSSRVRVLYRLLPRLSTAKRRPAQSFGWFLFP